MNKRTPSSERRHTGTKNKRRSDRSPEDTGDALRATRSARASVAATNASARELEAELVRFSTGDRSIDFNIDVTGETVWATQQQLADLFGKDVRTISEDITGILEEGEIDKATIRKFRIVRQEGERSVVREIEHYDLDMILAVGHRAKSPQATAFRKWAYAVLKSYLIKGYALNERRLQGDVKSADNLAAELRAIRSGEIHQFAKVRDFFKLASSDYDGSSKSCRAFYALLQDKFHFAACGMTACQLVLSRADHRENNMGMTSFAREASPTVDDAKVGKNYLSTHELRILHAVSEQFLLYVYSKALRGRIMTMLELAGKFDELLRVCGYEVFTGYGRDYQRPRAINTPRRNLRAL